MTNDRKKSSRNRNASLDSVAEPEVYRDFSGELDVDLSEFFTRHIVVDVKSITDEGMSMEFDVVGVLASVANAVRRALLVEVPGMAPETIMLQQNKSVMADEVLGHRIGLIPFKADPRKFKFRPPNSKTDHSDFTLLFELKISAPKQSLKSEKRFMNTKVYSSDFKFIPNQESFKKMEENLKNSEKKIEKNLEKISQKISQKNSLDDFSFRPVSENILVNILRPSQEMDLRIHVVKGIGKDHIKFSPVSLAAFRNLPTIRLLRPVTGEEAIRLRDSFSPGVIALDKDEDGLEMARVVDARLDSGSGNILRETQHLKSFVEFASEKNHFIFSVESIGALTVAALVKEANFILRSRCEYYYLSFGSGQTASAE